MDLSVLGTSQDLSQRMLPCSRTSCCQNNCICQDTLGAYHVLMHSLHSLSGWLIVRSLNSLNQYWGVQTLRSLQSHMQWQVYSRNAGGIAFQIQSNVEAQLIRLLKHSANAAAMRQSATVEIEDLLSSTESSVSQKNPSTGLQKKRIDLSSRPVHK